MHMKFGKHQGKHISEVPLKYLQWLLRENDSQSEPLRAEIERRTGNSLHVKANANDDWQMRIVKAGYRALLLKHHPDVGGTTADATALNLAYSKLAGGK